MKARIKWVENAAFVGETGSGHGVVIDGSPDIGGRNLGARPMELLLMGVASCSAMDVVYILNRARQPIVDCVVEAEAERAEQPPRVFTAIHLHFVVVGDDLNPAQVERAVRLSAEKYCSASIMLKEAASVTHDFEIRSAKQENGGSA